MTIRIGVMYSDVPQESDSEVFLGVVVADVLYHSFYPRHLRGGYQTALHVGTDYRAQHTAEQFVARVGEE